MTKLIHLNFRHYLPSTNKSAPTNSFPLSVFVSSQRSDVLCQIIFHF